MMFIHSLRQVFVVSAALAVVGLQTGSVMAQEERSRRVFDFSDERAAEGWFVVNDGVMGGVSSSRFESTEDGFATFEGVLSLENNGGFASVRSGLSPGVLAGATRLAIRVRGDGSDYQLRLRMGRRMDGVAYVVSFPTVSDEWTTVTIPIDAFQPSYRGYRPRNARPLQSGEAGQIGLMLTDKQDGPFRLEVAWIDAEFGNARP